jgi:hypothetical protein
MSGSQPERNVARKAASSESPSDSDAIDIEPIVGQAAYRGQLLRLLEHALQGAESYPHDVVGEPMSPAVREAIRAYRAHIDRFSQGGEMGMDATQDVISPTPRSRLEREWQTYQAFLRSDARAGDRVGAYILIIGDLVVGTFATRGEALDRGYATVGNQPFLVHRILDDEPTLDLPPYVS